MTKKITKSNHDIAIKSFESFEDMMEDDDSDLLHESKAILDLDGSKDTIENLSKISAELVKKGIPLSAQLKLRYEDFLKWKEYYHCFSISSSFWDKLSEFKEWGNLVKKERFDMSIDSVGNGKSVQIGINFSDYKMWEKAKEKIRDVLIRFFEHNSIIDYFQGCSTVKINSFPDIGQISNYAKKEKDMYVIAKEGLEGDKNFKVMLMGNTGTGKTYFSKMISRDLLELKKVGCVIWGTLGAVSEILEIKKDFDLPTGFLFVADELEFDSMSRERESSTAMVIKFFDNMENYNDVKFIGISNLPDLIDKALFRPERIDMIIFSSHSKMSEESILNILRSLNKKENKCKETELKGLSSFLVKKYKDAQLPNSFYSLALKLFKIFNKNTDKIAMILDEFYKKKDMYDFKNDKFNSVAKTGFITDED
jgi:hypothetical protein